LKEISKGIEEIAGGNLEYKINLRSNDELGLMAFEFNQMSEELKKAYNEIKDWSENLNRKVEQKNEELKKIYEQITQVEKLTSLGKLSATVAHELNNPLEGILTYSKLISKKLEKKNDGIDYTDILKFLSLISDESARCGKICKDLLLFSHRDEGNFSQSNFIDIIEKSLSLINHHFEINKIIIRRDYNDKDLIINCDSQKIEQALIAVLMNASEAMPNGGNLILTLAKELDNATLRITDEGSGINANDLPLIFEPFYTTKTNSKGTGLGLSVAYGIIKQHNGKIFVEHTSIKGTTFKITLPLKKS
jgi:two-component system NtrC family sensor kinase